MKDSRIGEALWIFWEGQYHDDETEWSYAFYTEDHVDAEHELIRRALASSLQRSGVVDSLGDAYRTLDNQSKIRHAHAGYIDGDETFLFFCDEDGFTREGDAVDKVLSITIVEVYS